MTKRSARVRKPHLSEQPADLRAEREAFVRTFLQKGIELTEGLLRENESLQQLVRKLDTENARLQSLLEDKRAVRDLLGAMKELEGQRATLTARADELEQAYKQQKLQHETMQQELNDLASLYVASFQLGGTLSVRRVVRHVSELLEQLIGAQSFVLYVLDADRRTAKPVAHRGVAAQRRKVVSATEGAIGDACLTGVPRIIDPLPETRTTEPIAAVPLLLDGVVVAVIAVYSLLPHKRGWALVDRELFKLLSAQAASAMIGANLFATQREPLRALRDIAAHLDAAPSSTAAAVAPTKKSGKKARAS